MKNVYKKFVPYFVVLGIFGALTWFVLRKGGYLQIKGSVRNLLPAEAKPASAAASSPVIDQLMQGLQHPLSLLLLQVTVIVIMARLFGRLARRINQPAVVGEIVAGICLGPSLLGWVWPASSQFLFPASSLQPLLFLGQIGLVFFMFVVGMQIDGASVKHKARDAVMISHVSIVLPFFLGVWLAYYLYPYFAPAQVSFIAFALFMGIAMSVTAFPVLARIVQERKLSGTPLGTLAITCAAADDITAWCLLAIVVAAAKSASFFGSLITIGLAMLFVSCMLYAVKPLLAKKVRRLTARNAKQQLVATILIVLLASAWVAEIIGIHALFGAFFAGVIMPANISLKKLITDKLEDVSTLILLPIFFVFTGLRTQIGLLNEPQLWLFFALIMLVAVGGKFGGSALTAKAMGQSWSSALSIGALMNTRGLMELVVLNIGYELGILSPQIFALLVLMALATTFMTGPLLSLVYKPAPTYVRPTALRDVDKVEFNVPESAA
jgi:Kef-type K+ transport system membrane component KefB